MYLNDLTVYYQPTDDEDALFLLKNVNQLDNKVIEHDFIAKFLQVAEKYDLHDNLMQSLLTHLLAMHENAFSLSLEREADVNDTLKALVMRDLTYFYDLFHSSFELMFLTLRMKYSVFVLSFVKLDFGLQAVAP